MPSPSTATMIAAIPVPAVKMELSVYRSRRRLVHGILTACLSIAVALGAYPAASSARLTSDSFERLVDVGGHRLYVRCMGSGAPSVILESGLGGTLDDWSLVQPEVARFTTVCSYDRANLGRSDRVSGPRTSQTTVTDLRALLAGAGIGGPYVLVGHSIGGFHVQLFARQDAGTNVTGVVFVDARPLGFHEEEARFGWPVLHSQPNPDGLDVLASDNEIRAAPGFPNLPLVVLTHTIAPPGAPAGLEQAWQDLQLQQSRLSPRGELVVAQCAGHYIHVDRPDLVIAAIARAASLTAPPQPDRGSCNNPPPPPSDAGANTSPGPQLGASASFAGCRAPTANVIRASAASNRLVGTARGERIFAGTGNDVVKGLGGNDCIDLGSGADSGHGGSGADLILGGLGSDRMSGSSGNDRLLGGGAADRLVGGPGNDRISGGSGSDTIAARDRRRDRVDCGAGRDTVIADRADRVARNCERIRRR